MIDTINLTLPITLIAFTDSKYPDIYWFIDGKFYTKSKSGESVVWLPIPGWHRFYAEDREGRSAYVEINVEKVPTF